MIRGWEEIQRVKKAKKHRDKGWRAGTERWERGRETKQFA